MTYSAAFVFGGARHLILMTEDDVVRFAKVYPQSPPESCFLAEDEIVEYFRVRAALFPYYCRRQDQ